MKQPAPQPTSPTRKATAAQALESTLSRIAKPAVIITLVMGMYLHLTRLFIGTEMLIKYIFTPTFDAVLAVPMLLGVISVWPAWKRIVFRNKFEKVIVAVTGVYFLASVPLHIQTYYTQRTDYVLIFPMWYSIVFLAFTSVLMFVWWRLKVEAGS